jgi:hypothetical protein
LRHLPCLRWVGGECHGDEREGWREEERGGGQGGMRGREGGRDWMGNVETPLFCDIFRACGGLAVGEDPGEAQAKRGLP